MSNQAKFTPKQRIHVVDYGQGTVLSYVGYKTPLTTVRVQFDSGDVKDFNENRLAAKLFAAPSFTSKTSIYPINEKTMPYDRFEVEPVCRVDTETWEVCGIKQAEMFSVYGHIANTGTIEDGCFQCVADCESMEAANQLHALLTHVITKCQPV